MGHSADKGFFKHKRSWSRRKDQLLKDYLPPYLEKVSHRLKKPIVLVDGFAGPGKFDDGEDGSPLIMYKLMRRKSEQTVPATLLAIEQDPELHARLAKLFDGKPAIEVVHSSFMGQVARLEELAACRTVFLYLDPFAIREYRLADLGRVFSLVQKGHSVEVLINLNLLAFVRLVAKWRSEVDRGHEGIDAEWLTQCAGGDWWKAMADGRSTRDMANEARSGFANTLRQYFNEVCFCDVMASSRHRFPKYTMVFASRSVTALELMNDAMAGANRSLSKHEASADAPLFAHVAETPAVAPTEIIIERLASPQTRKALRRAVMRSQIGNWLAKEINGEIREMLKSGRLRADSGKKTASDETVLSLP